MKKIVGSLFMAMLGGVVALGAFTYFNPRTETKVVSNNNSSIPVKYVSIPANMPETSINFVEAADMSVHAVVHVKTSISQDKLQSSNPFYNDPFFRDFFGQRQQPQQKNDEEVEMGAGSGVIISSDGYIVTNNHVVQNADKIDITLNDKRTYQAEVIGKDPATDLALLKIKEQNLPFITYGNSDDVKIGEWVLAVGNPFNLTSTVTAGIVSAKARNINIIAGDREKGLPAVESFIQTDAAVNPGNSGGALVNTSGQLVGINSAIASNTGSYTGYSFAIPVNIVKKIVGDLMEFGEVQRAFIGVSIRDIDSKFAEEKNIKSLKGVYVNGLTDGGAAKESGVKEGDVITKVGEVDVNNVPELQEQISRFRPGQKVMVTLIRDNSEKTIPVTLRNKDGNTSIVKHEAVEETIGALGASFETVSADEMKKLGIDGGVRVKSLNSGKLRAAGIKEGFIITSIDRKKVNSSEDLKTALKNKQGGVLIEGVYPNGLKAYYGFGI